MGPDELPRRERDHSSGDQLVRPGFWSEAISHWLHLFIHDRVCIVRYRWESWLLDHGARDARRGRRRIATNLAGSVDGKFSAGETRNGHGGFYDGHCCRADSWADDRRMAHLQ